jgi:hypothetical protein
MIRSVSLSLSFYRWLVYEEGKYFERNDEIKVLMNVNKSLSINTQRAGDQFLNASEQTKIYYFFSTSRKKKLCERERNIHRLIFNLLK